MDELPPDQVRNFVPVDSSKSAGPHKRTKLRKEFVKMKTNNVKTRRLKGLSTGKSVDKIFAEAESRYQVHLPDDGSLGWEPPFSLELVTIDRKKEICPEAHPNARYGVRIFDEIYGNEYLVEINDLQDFLDEHQGDSPDHLLYHMRSFSMFSPFLPEELIARRVELTRQILGHLVRIAPRSIVQIMVDANLDAVFWFDPESYRLWADTAISMLSKLPDLAGEEALVQTLTPPGQG